MAGFVTSPFVDFWRKLPLLIRAVLSGLFVFAIVGSVVMWLVMVFIPAPWSIFVMGIVLWVYWQVVSGRWWFGRSVIAGREYCRATTLSAGVGLWSMIAALLIVAVLQAGFVVTFRIIEFPSRLWTLAYDLTAVPVWIAWLFVIMAALTAGLTEEVGFRGYMQVPLEKHYGAPIGIGLVSIVFVVFHLHQTWAPSVLLLLIVVSAMWGSLAYTSGSLIPGIISHTVADIINFSYWWTDVAGSFDKRPISETGFDVHFFIWLMILGVSILLFALSMRKIQAKRHTRRKENDPDGT
ncbi:MAG: CPBP family intramembrane metalloprotease [Gammaproteobacteria bacterium]|nr:CPBP family intramembrane metalloprotease [Gammaproteobacteria bacterium]MDH5653032.1 CPBP family intramembrane metalloprotease [Gammaproteobacteria bacterium]